MQTSQKHDHILLTPLNPTFILYIVLILVKKNIDCRYLLGAVLTSTHNLWFEQDYEKYQIFLSENFPFVVVNFSIYLNRRVFVMKTQLDYSAESQYNVRFILVLSDGS